MDEAEHKARIDRMRATELAISRADEDAQTVRLENSPNQKCFTFATRVSLAFRELAATLRGSAHPTLTQSHLLELLLAHWHESPPDSRWVLDFEFVTKRGRPKASS